MTPPADLPPDRRAVLADKGRRLYRKFCGTGGRGICAESFAVYHIGRGESAVADDLVAHLDDVIRDLERDDPDGRLAATRGLAARVRRHLADAGELPRTGSPLREFVLENNPDPDAVTSSPAPAPGSPTPSTAAAECGPCSP